LERLREPSGTFGQLWGFNLDFRGSGLPPHTAQPMALHGALLCEGKLATDWLSRAPRRRNRLYGNLALVLLAATAEKAVGGMTTKANSNWQDHHLLV